MKKKKKKTIIIWSVTALLPVLVFVFLITATIYVIMGALGGGLENASRVSDQYSQAITDAKLIYNIQNDLNPVVLRVICIESRHPLSKTYDPVEAEEFLIQYFIKEIEIKDEETENKTGEPKETNMESQPPQKYYEFKTIEEIIQMLKEDYSYWKFEEKDVKNLLELVEELERMENEPEKQKRSENND